MTDHVEVMGLRIAYERLGAGSPVVLVHGFVGDADSTWSHQLRDLSDAYTVVAWDLPGAGRSSDPPERFRLPDYSDCLAAVVRALGFDRAHLVGLSFGAMVLLETVRRHPAVAETLVLAGGYAGWAGSLAPADVAERLRLSLRRSERPAAQFAEAMIPTMFSGSAPPEAVARFAASVQAFHPAGFRAMARASAEADLRDVLPQITVPTLVLHGDQDLRSPLSVARALHSAIPMSRLVVLPGTGHVSPVEAPEAFDRAVRDFLQAGSPRVAGLG